MSSVKSKQTTMLINENKVRLVALWVFILNIVSFWIATPFIFTFLLIDFFLRSFGYGKYSPLGMLSDTVIRYLHIAGKPIYFIPKQFAARIGFVLCCVILASLAFHVSNIVMAGIIIFSVFAFLESFIGLCAGCYVFYFLTYIKLIKQ